MKMHNPLRIRSVSVEIVGDNVSPWKGLPLIKLCAFLQLVRKHRDSLAIIYISSLILDTIYDVTQKV
jgi:hypothetical protein